MKLMWTDIKKEFNEKGYFEGHEYECSQKQNVREKGTALLASNK